MHPKGKEKFLFNYGVYLLNKNIAQLRNSCGLATQVIYASGVNDAGIAYGAVLVNLNSKYSQYSIHEKKFHTK